MSFQTSSAAAREALRIAGNCYYDSTIARPSARAPLTGDTTADVVVIGAGFAGLWSALELARRGRKVVVLEAGRMAGAASGRNGGQVLPGFSCGLEVITAQLGAPAARRAWDLSIEGMEMVRDRAQAAGTDCDFTPGWMLLAARAHHIKDLKAWHEQMSTTLAYGSHVRFVAGSELATYTASKAYHAAIVDDFAAHLNPLKFALALAADCLAAGVEIFENSAATAIESGSPNLVRVGPVTVRATHVIVAANVFIDSLVQPVAGHVMPVGNTIIATEALAPELVESLLYRRYACCDTNFLLDYYKITPDRRMLWGGGSTYMRHDSENRVASLRAKMVRMYPQLAQARVEFTWGGLIDVTMSRAPDFGMLAQNVVYLQGFSGHGVNVTAIAGRLAAEALCGQSERFALLAAIAHRNFPGGPYLRRLGLSLGTWYYRARDALTR